MPGPEHRKPFYQRVMTDRVSVPRVVIIGTATYTAVDLIGGFIHDVVEHIPVNGLTASLAATAAVLLYEAQRKR